MMSKIRIKKLFSVFLIVVILCSSIEISFATNPEWWVYAFQSIESKEHFVSGSIVPANILNTIGMANIKSTFIPLKVRDATITKVESGRWSSKSTSFTQPDPGTFVIDGQKHDYTLPVKHLYRFTYDNNKREDFMPLWLMENYVNNQKVDPKSVEYLKADFGEALDTLQSLSNKITRQGEPSKAGDYHPMHKSYATNAIREWKQILLGRINSTEFNEYLYPEKIEVFIPLLYDVIEYIEFHRINESEILDFKIGEYSGVIDKEQSLVNIYIPKDVVLDKSKVEITTPDWVVGRYKSGDFKAGNSAIYTIRPIDALHDKYIKEYNLKDYSQLEREWTINVLEKEPEVLINSLSYTSEYGEKIDAIISADRINLEIPFYVDLSNINLDIYHTGIDAFYIDKNDDEIKIEYNKNLDLRNIKKIKIKKDNLAKIYDLEIISRKSTNNEILYFGVKDYNTDIDHLNEEIYIELPYGVDITALKPDIIVDYRSKMVPKSNTIQDFTNPVLYTVTSESGDIKKYEVKASNENASSENNILDFSIGNIKGEIENNNISIRVPKTLDLKKIQPKIEISTNAKVYPESFEEVDFSQGSLEYTVTAQNGEKQIYIVTLTLDGEQISGPSPEYIQELKTLRDNIYKRYEKETISEDWEWMNIGFFQGKDNGMKDGKRSTLKDLPSNLNLYKEIGELNANKTTDLARFAMMLTSLGIDATNLKLFEVDEKPFKTDLGRPYGAEVTNLIEMMYKKSAVGINDGIFALIAYDMGNYSTPQGATLTREKLIEILLEHEYGSDGFGVDMVAMLMQALYPYRSHPVYGEQVKDKLQHGLELILGIKSAKKVEPVNKDFLGISWGDVNSESTSQIIIALCSMGIDPYSDIRFSRGPKDNMIVNWTNKFATPKRDGFGHTNNTNNFMGTYQGMYAIQWYINFIESGSKPYSLYYDGVPFDFSTNFSSEAKITYFELLGKQGNIDEGKGTITVEIPIETADEQLKTSPIVKISENAKVSPATDIPQDFGKEISYTVTAEDGSTVKTYRIIVSKKEDVVSGEKEITSFTIAEFPKAKISIDKQNREISVVLPSDTEASKLKHLTVSIGYNGDNISPDTNGQQDFTNDVVYTITAKDGSTVKYTVKVSLEKVDEYEFTKFVLRGVEGKIDTISNEINIKLPFGAYLENIKPNEVKYEPYKNTTAIVPAPTALRNFEDQSIYKIVPYPSDNTVEYNVKINYVEVGGNSSITSFSIGGYTGKIDKSSITLNTPTGKTEKQFREELGGKVPNISWTGKSIDPMPNGENNSVDDYLKDYVLSDEDGNVNTYIVKFSRENGNVDPDDTNQKNIEITSFIVNGIKATIDNGNGRIFIEIPFETENYRVSPIITTSEGTSIYPDLRQSIDLRKNNIFTLKKGDAYKHYTLIVRRAEPKPATLLWKYMEEDLKIPYYQRID